MLGQYHINLPGLISLEIQIAKDKTNKHSLSLWLWKKAVTGIVSLSFWLHACSKACPPVV